MTGAPRTVVHYSDAESFGGTERTLLHLVAHLDPARWRSVLLHHPAGAPPELVDRARALGAVVRPAPHAARVAEFGRLPALVRALRDLAPAVLHAHQTWPLSCKFAVAAAAAARVPAVVATVQLFVDPRREARWGALQHRALSACVTRHVAVSQGVAGRLRALGVPARRLRVVHNAVDVDRFAAPVDAARRRALRVALGADALGASEHGGAPVVLAVARLEAQKALDVLVDAAALLPGVVVAVAGEGEERVALEARARRRGVADRVRFLGHRDDVPALLAAADVFALPSRHEGFPLAVLEAFAAGMPVVATAVEGTLEAVADGVTGLLVPPGDPAALAAAVRRVLDDRVLAERLAANGRAGVAREGRADVMARRIVAVYEECLAPQSSQNGGPILS